MKVSGEVPLEPVVSRKTGHLFERRLVEKYLQEEGKCPITGEVLEVSDLLPLSVSKLVRPRLSTSASVPGLLSLLQTEWDDIVLETFNLKQALDAARKDLSQALYQHDAACRVIARLMRERDEARSATAELHVQGSDGSTLKNGTGAVQTGSVGKALQANTSSSAIAVLEHIDALMIEKMQLLSSARRGRKPSQTLRPRDVLSGIKTSLVATPHKAAPGGITSIALQQSLTGDRILTGGMDKDALLMSIDGSMLAKLSGHDGAVTAVAFSKNTSHASPLFTASADKMVKLWSSKSDVYDVDQTFIPHDGQVSALSVLPIETCILSFSFDGSWALLDVLSQSIVRKVRVSGSRLLCGQVHPDGLLLGTGGDSGVLNMFDIREQKSVCVLEGHSGGITSLSFSENGYSLAAGDIHGILRLWDLRKMSCANKLERKSRS